MKTYNAMSFFEFQEQFQNEEACFRHLQELRWPDGFKCPTCGQTQVYFIEPHQTIKTDAYPSYNILSEDYDHLKEIVKPFEAMDKLPWVHILIGNVKSFIRGTYHGVSHKHLQPYLKEFRYRFNRRFNVRMRSP
jgi:hypothetical protein